MIGSLLEGAGATFAEGMGGNLLKRIFGTALFFWSAGIVLLAWQYGTSYIFITLSLLNPLQQFMVVFSMFGILILSDTMMTWATFHLMKWVEGYAPPPLDAWWHDYSVKPLHEELEKKVARWQRLRKKGLNHLTPDERQNYNQINFELSFLYPANFDHLMPTRVGNILRAAEDYPNDRYGLETITMWSRLWLVMPEEARQEIAHARMQLDHAVRLMGWGMAFSMWFFFSIWAYPLLITLPMGIAMVMIAYRRAIHAAQMYADLIRTAFDLYRHAMYEQMGWDVPATLHDEKACGKALTSYIFFGELSS